MRSTVSTISTSYRILVGFLQFGDNSVTGSSEYVVMVEALSASQRPLHAVGPLRSTAHATPLVPTRGAAEWCPRARPSGRDHFASGLEFGRQVVSRLAQRTRQTASRRR